MIYYLFVCEWAQYLEGLFQKKEIDLKKYIYYMNGDKYNYRYKFSIIIHGIASVSLIAIFF